MYCNSLTNYNRFRTRQIKVGKIDLGGEAAIRVQTMTNTDTGDIEASVEQIITCFEKGADLVRVSVPTLKDVEALKQIQVELHKVISDKPLIADIHFNPKIAYEACGVAQKIRINPGNFVKSQNKEYTNKEYQEELDLIESRLKPLFERCQKNNSVVRIGTNYGSLSYRVVNRYGNTVEGLVQATLEYIEIFRKNNFHNIVISIKASNPVVMVEANRLLVEKMKQNNYAYPIHLGVTEAGNGLEGRVKSAMGIGALLIDGIGDTIRVSLTESPEKELPVAAKIIEAVKSARQSENLPEAETQFFTPYSFNKRKTYSIGGIGGDKVPIVIVNAESSEYGFSGFVPDYMITTKTDVGDLVLDGVKNIVHRQEWSENDESVPLFTVDDYVASQIETNFCFVEASLDQISREFIEKVRSKKNAVLIVFSEKKDKIGEFRLVFDKLNKHNCHIPVILRLDYSEKDIDNLAIKAAVESSVFFIDGLASGIYINNCASVDLADITDLSFEILQASHRRLTKTEFISCPSCARTLFPIEEVTEEIKARMGHLKGLKIAVMGCIVNGPGEVADADYGYIGSGKGKVSLFRGKELIKRDIPAEKAIDELIDLIKNDDKWIDI